MPKKNSVQVVGLFIKKNGEAHLERDIDGLKIVIKKNHEKKTSKDPDYWFCLEKKEK